MARRERSSKSVKVAEEAYSYACCAVCGIALRPVLDVAHLDQDPANDAPDNLAFLCKTHHWMVDCGLYPIDAVKLLRDNWQRWNDAGKPIDHSLRMKDAGEKAGKTRRRRAAARKAVATRKANQKEEEAQGRDGD